MIGDRADRMLWQRILTVAVLLPAFLAALFLLPVFWWTLLAFVLVMMAGVEWGRLVPLGDAGVIAFCVVLALSCLYVYYADAGLSGYPLAVCVAAVAFWVVLAPLALAVPGRCVPRVVVAAAGLLVLVAAFVALASARYEPGRLLALMGVVWVADTAAYLVGRRYGRHRLAPRVSPGKTWEGVAGAAGGVLVYFLLVWVAWSPRWVGFDLLWDGTLVAIVFVLGMVGDLFESWLKRRAGVKDSGTLLPGHGGVLDRVDALLPILPALTLFYSLRW